MKTIEEIVEDFTYAEEWEDKYTYLIELGNKVPLLTQAEQTEENKVPGCMSQVWITYEEKDGKFYFRANSDASIVRGLSAIITAIFSGKTASEILETSPEKYLEEMNILEHISPNRRNGLASMIDVIKNKISGK